MSKNKNRKHRRHLFKVGQLKKGKPALKMHSTEPMSNYVLTNSEEMAYLSRYILDYPNIETGGQLFGYWTYDGNPVVLFVLGPGINAGHYNAFFMQDLYYLRERAKILSQVYGLNHIGEWHSHHQLGLSRPSGHDAHNISTNMRKLGYHKFLLCIGTCTETASTINAYMFSSNKDGFEHVPWKVKDTESPFRNLISSQRGNYFLPPKKELPNMVDLFLHGKVSKNNSRIGYSQTYWLNERDNRKVLKNILVELNKNYPNDSFIPSIDGNNEVHIEIVNDNRVIGEIYFPKGFPETGPVIYDSHGVQADLPWEYNGDILLSFMKHYNKNNQNKL